MKVAGWWLWWAITVVWTAALIVPTPTPTFLGPSEETRQLVKLIVSKTAHVVAYAAWTVLSGWLRPSLGRRLLLLLFLLAHGVVTEWIQEQLPYRSGLLRDAALDHLGVLLGLAASWRWWTSGPSSENQ